MSMQVSHGQLIVNGTPKPAASSRTFDVRHPGTGQVLTQCAEGDAVDIDAAVQAAKAAGPDWAGRAPAERGAILKRFADVIDAHSQELATLTTLEMGKPMRESAAIDGPHTAMVFRHYGEWCNKIYGETTPVSRDYLNYILPEPLGVVGAITPWNFPTLLAAWKLAPALAVGNTVVLKPAEQSPLGSIRLAELALEAGLPAGVFNVVPGFGPTAGAALTAHPDVAKISFTGEHLTAQKIMASAAGNLKKLSLECGGKSPHIIFEDADLDRAEKAAFFGIFSNAGQVCNSGSRLLVHAGVKEELESRLATRWARLRIGDPLSLKTQMGPVVSAAQQERVNHYIRAGQEDGARVLAGGTPSELATGGGFFVTPTIFTDVRNNMRIARDEVFGPVLSIIAFEDEAEALAIANDTVYGLAAGVWTRDMSRGHRMARKLHAGTVWVNCYNMYDLSSPFGGYKISGIGKELGRHALDLYTQHKSVWIGLQ